MNEALLITIKRRMERTAQALRKNNMAAYCVDSVFDVVPLIKSIINKGDTVAAGGSMSLAEAGVIDLLKSGDYNYLDRYNPELSSEDIDTLYRKVFSADCYFSSSNAITENGELYNVDGNANRVAAITFGPKKVIIVAGYNKITSDLNSAHQHVCEISAPANATRLSCKTPCAQTGKCIDCNSEGRICCTTTIHKFQRIKDRITIILVADKLGY